MNGLELSRSYFERYARPMLERDFPELLPYLAAGFTGSGSEHYGYDDESSRDHDFEPGFCLFLPGEEIIDRRQEFRLERAYAKLPKEYMGFTRQWLSPVGGNRHGVMRTAEFYQKAIGSADGVLSVDQWLHIPDYALAEAVNGEIFFDGFGEVSRIREALKTMPEDVRLKRLAGNLLIMAQAGQYNFARCLGHGEPEAAQLACHEFVSAAMKAAFLLRGQYMPYYKWSFRALRELEGTGALAGKLSILLHEDCREETGARTMLDTIEEICAGYIAELTKNGLSEAVCADLEKHAYSVNDRIRDGSIRNLHILTAV